MFSHLIPSWAKKNRYGSVRLLLGVYFGPDHDIFGDSIDEIMDSYLESVNDITTQRLKKQLCELLDITDDHELEIVMVELAEKQFTPEPWNETWRSFIQKVMSYLPD